MTKPFNGGPRLISGLIVVPLEDFARLHIDARATLMERIKSESLHGPKVYRFADTPEVRRLLKMPSMEDVR